MDLYQLVADAEKRDALASYGIDPTRVETWLQDRTRQYRDPTAETALRNIAAWERRKAAR